MKVLIAEDEPLAARRLVMELGRIGDIDIVGPYEHGVDARRAIVERRPDVALLDVQMPGANGFEVLQGLGEAEVPLVIFTTAYKRYAVSAFKAGAIDYLLKPIDSKALELALDKARSRLREQDAESRSGELRALLSQMRTDADVNSEYKSAFWVKGTTQNIRVSIHDLESIEAVRDYVLMHTRSRSHLMRGKISGLEQQLDPSQFIRVHRSYILNVKFIRASRKLKAGGKVITMASGKEIRVGRKYAAAIGSWL